MKILLCSHFFHPDFGGIETVSRVLASQFTAAGHEVIVATQTAQDDGTSFPFTVVRKPGPLHLLRLTTWCDVCLHNNISLRAAWPLLMVRRPWVVAHHMWLARTDDSIGWQDRLKQFAARHARNLAASRALAATLGAPASIVGNPYDDATFRTDAAATRDGDLIFVGRLLADKGVDLLFEALVRLREADSTPRLCVVGSGPAEAELRALAARLGLDAQVEFAGRLAGVDLAARLNRHRIIVVPSRARESFGLVAIEGLACGCVPVVARQGGLPEAIGPCGVSFAPGDAADLARCLAALLAPGADLRPLLAGAPAHLAQHTAQAVAAGYLRVIEEARNA